MLRELEVLDSSDMSCVFLEYMQRDLETLGKVDGVPQERDKGPRPVTADQRTRIHVAPIEVPADVCPDFGDVEGLLLLHRVCRESCCSQF